MIQRGRGGAEGGLRHPPLRARVAAGAVPRGKGITCVILPKLWPRNVYFPMLQASGD